MLKIYSSTSGIEKNEEGMVENYLRVSKIKFWKYLNATSIL